MPNKINEYLHSLQYDTENINLCFRKLFFLPNLNKFTNIKNLNYDFNQLTQIHYLPNTLVELNCHCNQLTQLNHLPNTLQNLSCGYNKFFNSVNLL